MGLHFQILLQFEKYDWITILVIPIVVYVMYLLGMWWHYHELVAFTNGDGSAIDAYYAFAMWRSLPWTLIILGSVIAILFKRKIKLFRNLLVGCLLGKVVLIFEGHNSFLLRLLSEFVSGRQAVLLTLLLMSISLFTIILSYYLSISKALRT